MKQALRIPLALTAALLLTVPSGLAQRGGPPGSRAPDAQDEEKAEEKEEEEEKEPDRWFAVTGGDVYTVTQGMVRGGTVLCKNGKIQKVGHDVAVPEGSETIDASGLRVYPGLIALNSSRIVGNEPPEDNTDVFALNLVLALSSGVTTVVTGNTAAKLTYGTLEGMVVKKNLFARVSLRSSANWRQFREELEKIRAHDRKVRDYQLAKARGEEVEEPKAQGLNANYVKMLKGEVTARFDLADAHSLRRLAKLAQEYGFSGVIGGAREGWVVAEELGRAGFSCILNPRTTRQADRASNLPNGARIENAAMLHERGVPVGVVPSSAGISLGGLVGEDLFTLPIEAAYAVRGGLPRRAALESITIGAARILGIQDHVGSVEVGKDADLIVTDGDVLHYRTMTYYAVVNGRLAYDKAEESLLSHVRPLDGPSRYAPAEILEMLEEVHPEEGGEEEGEEGAESGEEEGEGEGEGEKKEGEGGDGS